jgi:hypothetical protein
MKTPIPEKITSVLEAKAFLKALHLNGEAFHPEDPAAEIIDYRTRQRLFTDEEAAKIEKALEQVYLYMNDPCEYYLNLMIKFNDAGIAEPFEITGTWQEHMTGNGHYLFTPDWYESEEAEEWYDANYENVEDMYNESI